MSGGSTAKKAVDAYVARAPRWREEIRALRSILLGTGLEEGIKWGKPCYTFEGANVAIVQPFAACCALMFFKGALIDDPRGLLRSQGPNSRSARRLEFTSVDAIDAAAVRALVRRAIAVERKGLRVAPRESADLELPEEFRAALRRDRDLARAFEALTPGRRRGYAIHVAGAKRSDTRVARIERCRAKILAGKGLNDR